MASRMDDDTDNHTEHRSFERRIQELEKSEVWTKGQINSLINQFESEKATHARTNLAQDKDIMDSIKRIDELKYVIYERIDAKISNALTEMKAYLSENRKTNDERIQKLDAQVHSLANKMLYATGFLAGLQFFLQVIVPFLQKKGLS